MKKIFFISFLLVTQNVFSQNINLTLRSQLDFTNEYSNLWGYVDDFGNEYALLGTWQGVSIINVTNPDTPVIVINIPSAVPNGGAYVWREIKTFNHHAFVTNEEDSALLIIDLTNLPNNNISWHHFFDHDMQSAHTDFIDENGILYVFGFNTYAGVPQNQRGALVYDLNPNPDVPVYLGQYNGNYIHDGFVRGDTLWASEVYQGKLAIINATNPNAMVQMASFTTPLAFTHNSWPTHDNHYTFTTDEKPNSSLASYDVSDLSNLSPALDEAQSNPGSNSVIHNVHLYNDDFALCSYYRDGVVIFDVSDPANIIEVGNYDTYPGSGDGYDGNWGVYPWLPSGNIISSDIDGGLYVFTPHYQKACRIQGVVTDSITNALLNGAAVEILQPAIIDSTNYLGTYATGVLNQGLYDVQFSMPGYITKTFYGVQLDSAQTITLDAQLIPDVPFDISMTVVDSASGNPIPFAEVFIDDGFQYTFSFTADAAGVVSLNQIYTSTYNIYSASWGHKTRIFSSQPLNQLTTGLTIALPKGYYDDFFFNLGWTATGNATSGAWERGNPQGTMNGADECNAGIDVTNDFGLQCYVTGNGGGNAGDDDVDGGSAILTSPVFDLAGSADPRIHFNRWFYNGGSNPNANDSLRVFISNGDSTKMVDYIIADTTLMSEWIFNDLRVKDFLQPSNNMKLIVRTADNNPAHLCEGGFDLFEVIDTAVGSAISELQIPDFRFQIFPNPSDGIFTLSFSHPIKSSKMEITNTLGQIIYSKEINQQSVIFYLKSFSNGIYFVKIISDDFVVTKRIVVE